MTKIRSANGFGGSLEMELPHIMFDNNGTPKLIGPALACWKHTKAGCSDVFASTQEDDVTVTVTLTCGVYNYGSEVILTLVEAQSEYTGFSIFKLGKGVGQINDKITQLFLDNWVFWELAPDEPETADAQPAASARWVHDGASHPVYGLADWAQEVGAGNTRLGYEDWVNHQIEANQA